jgi:predicted phosphoribosyltransferase
VRPPARYEDRRDAGVALAAQLYMYDRREDLVVLALPRGGVPVAFEVARSLAAPLDVFVVRKLGVPDHPELAMGAIASGGVRVLSDDIVELYRISPNTIEAVTRAERVELERRERVYRNGRPAVSIRGNVAILVDDGLATGSSMHAAVVAVRRLHPAGVVVAVPVGSRQACAALREVADQVICPFTPEPFAAVGLWYHDFSETSDDEVRRVLANRTLEGAVKRSA